MSGSLSGVLLFLITELFGLSRYWLLLLFVGAFVVAAYLTWDEEREHIEELLADITSSKAAKSEGSLLSRSLFLDPVLRAQDSNTRAMENLAREMRRQKTPDLFAYVREGAIGTVEGQLRIDVALEIANRGAATPLCGWQAIIDSVDGYHQTIDRDAFIKDEIAPSTLTHLKERKCINLANYAKAIRRDSHISGWISIIVPIPLNAQDLEVDLRLFDQLNRRVEILYSPLHFQRGQTS